MKSTAADRHIHEFKSILNSLDVSVQGIAGLQKKLLCYSVNHKKPEDFFSWTVCVLALQAVSRGNFGIGSVLVDGTGTIIEAGHNEVFAPHFRSDCHAEMVVMTRFEARKMQNIDLRTCTLYTSLESCPMCLCRMISSGVGKVLYVAADDIGGMVRRRRNLPTVWQKLMKVQEHRQARCSSKHKRGALDIFQANVHHLNSKLTEKKQPKFDAKEV
jgi:tRNA(Arg) A34 adenosine deaminase TadA